MAGRAPGLRMSANQRKSGFTVREPRWIAHLMPGLQCMALLAIPFYLTMGILVARLGKRSICSQRNYEHCEGGQISHGVAPLAFTSSVPWHARHVLSVIS